MTTLRASRQFTRLLIVDDEPSVLYALKLLLEALGFSIQDFTSPFEAAEHLSKESRYDAILCDLRMPEMDGIALLSHAKKCAPSVPFILISGHAQVEEIEKAQGLGADGFLDKPFTPDELAAMLQKIADARRK